MCIYAYISFCAGFSRCQNAVTFNALCNSIDKQEIFI